jgi:hypothetical protein
VAVVSLVVVFVVKVMVASVAESEVSRAARHCGGRGGE